MLLEYKSVPFEIKAVTDADDGGWEIAGLASTWWGEPDSYNDVVAPGAFAESIASRSTKFFYEHREPIGRQLELREDERGLFGRWSIVDTTAGADAYKLARAGVLDSLSIGYLADDVEFRDDGVRVLKRVTLLEVSAVALPANQHAIVTDVKAEDKAVWSAAYINDLSDSAFALILPGGEKDDEGKTTPRSLRKLPHHDAGGKLDQPHLNNALSRAPQMTGVSDAQRDKAIAHLRRHKEKSDAAAEHEPEIALIADAFAIDLEPIRRRLTAIGILEA
jgi:Escherichia/Staphylococcus phage prohead protease